MSDFKRVVIDADWVAEDFSNIAYLCDDIVSAFGVSVGDVRGYLTCVGFGKRLNKGDKEGQVSKTTIVLSVCTCGATCAAPPVRFRNLKDNAACATCAPKVKADPLRSVNGVRTPEYNIYSAMIQRCCNANSNAFSYYGGRGIKICDRWLNKEDGFHNFVTDMGLRPEGLSLDRIDVNGDYCPENCRWADQSVQVFNMRTSTLNSTGRTGVYFDKRRNNWYVRITHEGNVINLGSYKTYDKACEVRTNAELKYFGELKPEVRS